MNQKETCIILRHRDPVFGSHNVVETTVTDTELFTKWINPFLVSILIVVSPNQFNYTVNSNRFFFPAFIHVYIAFGLLMSRVLFCPPAIFF